MSSNNRDFKFSRRASSYDDGFEGKASRKFYQLLQREVALKSDFTLLDVGCGTGALLRKLSDICAFNGHGIDTEEAMVAQAKIKCPEMDIRCSRCENTPFDDHRFDVIVACMAYHHFSDKTGFAREAARLLKPDGVLYIADPRFPFLVRKAVNGILRLARIEGEFFTSDEIAMRFAAYGFLPAGSAFDGYAQVVKLKKNQNAVAFHAGE